MARSAKPAPITALFDYDSLDAGQRSIIQQRTGEIRERLRRSAQAFGDKFAILSNVNIATSLLYQLASPSVPEELRDQILRAAEQGETMTAKELKATIQKRRLKSVAARKKKNSSKGAARQSAKKQ